MPIVDEDEIKIISNEVQEIISYRPVWLVRNGIVLFLLIIAALLGATFFIRYPDIIHVNAKLTSINAPKEIKTKTDGKLIRLKVKEGNMVFKNDIIGFMESRANADEMILFSKVIDSMQLLLNKNETEIAINYFNAITIKHAKAFPPAAGEIEGAVSTFMQSFNLFSQYLSKGYYLQKKKMLTGDIVYLQQLYSNLQDQKQLQEQDLLLAKQTLDANKSLNDDKVISALDYRNEKSKFIGKSLTIPQITSAIINNGSSRHEKEKEIAQLENEILQQKGIFVQSLNVLKAQLEEWKNKYVLIAPISGSISFANFYQENQQIKMNETICYINPENTQYFAQVLIPQSNFGKIKAGQKVLLKLLAYPYQEFGPVKGRLDFISNIPTDSGYLAKVILPMGLKTNYKLNIQYHEGMLAQGEIVTADTKLSDRLFYQFKSLIKN